MREALQLIAAHEASAAMMLPTPGRDDMWQTLRQMHLSTAVVLRQLIAEPDERMLAAGAQAMGIMGNKLSSGDVWRAMSAARQIEVSPTSVDLIAGLRAQRDALKERGQELAAATLRALSAALVPSWQPIETAPLSTSIPAPHGRVVRAVYLLGYLPDEAALDPQGCISVIWWEPHLDGGRWQSEADVPIRPTHWMPLPKAPEVTP